MLKTQKGGKDLKKRRDDDISLLGRATVSARGTIGKIRSKKLLSSFWARQRRLASYEGSESSEEAKLSFGFSIARIASVVLLVILLLTTLLFSSGGISYEQIYYMLKDIGYIKTYGESAPSSLNYSMPVQNQEHTVFKNGLAVAGDSEIKLFTSTGRVTLTEGSEFTNPRMCSSDEYLLIYDQGRQGYALYNSFIALRREKTDYPISLADMAENGGYLIVTSSSTYTSVVRIFNSAFEPICEYQKNDRVISAALSSDGRYAAVLSLSAQGGEALSTLSVIDSKTENVKYSASFEGSMPYVCDFLNDDRVVVILGDKVTVFDKNGNQRSEYAYPGELSRFDIRGDRLALLFKGEESGANGTAVIFDVNGTPVITTTVDFSVRDMRLGDGAVYFLSSNEVVRMSTSIGGVSRADADGDKAGLLVFSDGRVVLCTQSVAKYISFD